MQRSSIFLIFLWIMMCCASNTIALSNAIAFPSAGKAPAFLWLSRPCEEQPCISSARAIASYPFKRHLNINREDQMDGSWKRYEYDRTAKHFIGCRGGGPGSSSSRSNSSSSGGGGGGGSSSSSRGNDNRDIRTPAVIPDSAAQNDSTYDPTWAPHSGSASAASASSASASAYASASDAPSTSASARHGASSEMDSSVTGSAEAAAWPAGAPTSGSGIAQPVAPPGARPCRAPARDFVAGKRLQD